MPSTRLYINITNHCNVACPFCCMYSSPAKHTFLPLQKFAEILAVHQGYELQLEGGEPMLHPQIKLFLGQAWADPQCKKLIVLTNGLNLRKDLQDIVAWRGLSKTPTVLKISVNSFLMKQHPRFLFEITLAIQNIQFIPNFSIQLNVRKSYEDPLDIEQELKKYNLLSFANNIFYFNRYGRLKEDKRYGDIVINQNIDTWKVYASDGTCFNTNLVARSEYENELH